VQLVETPNQRAKVPQKEARKTEQDAYRSEQLVKKVEQPEVQVIDFKQKIQESLIS
jgi:hypothetical protein